VTKVNLEAIIPASLGFDNLEEQHKQIYPVHEDIQVLRYSTRSKKLPVTRNGDFLWEILV
jgi:hypothetical protein